MEIFLLVRRLCFLNLTLTNIFLFDFYNPVSEMSGVFYLAIFGIIITSLTGETGKYPDNSDHTEAGEAFIGKTSRRRVLY